MNKIAIFLCDITGKMGEPWLNAGYDIILVDPQHPVGVTVELRDNGTTITKVGHIIEHPTTWGVLREAIVSGRVVFVMGFPPCTDVAVSGSRWFATKRAVDPHFQAKAALVAEQCRSIGNLSGAPWAFENPVSVFSSIFGKPNYIFSPEEFTGHCAEDNYTKTTCLWTGNGFVMPKPYRDAKLGPPDDRIHKASPGPERANFRSATPKGFSMAAFLSNAPHFKGWTQSPT